MKVKTSELKGAALDWAVAKCERIEVRFGLWKSLWLVDKDVFGKSRCLQGDDGTTFAPDYNWADGGPIIEREKITIEPLRGGGWCATFGCTPHDFLLWDQEYQTDASYGEGCTPLIAAMRCYVASKLGDEVDIPEKLL